MKHQKESSMVNEQRSSEDEHIILGNSDIGSHPLPKTESVLLFPANEPGNELVFNLKGVMADLRNGKDIEGSVLVNGEHAVIVSDLPKDTDNWMKEDEILGMIHEWKGSLPLMSKKTMFPQFIKDHNGCNILAKRLINDLTLLVVMRGTGYLGLAMLEIESSIQRAQRLMKENGLHNYQE